MNSWDPTNAVLQLDDHPPDSPPPHRDHHAFEAPARQGFAFERESERYLIARRLCDCPPGDVVPRSFRSDALLVLALYLSVSRVAPCHLPPLGAVRRRKKVAMFPHRQGLRGCHESLTNLFCRVQATIVKLMCSLLAMSWLLAEVHMDWTREGNWRMIKDSVKEKWGTLTNDALNIIDVVENS